MRGKGINVCQKTKATPNLDHEALNEEMDNQREINYKPSLFH